MEEPTHTPPSMVASINMVTTNEVEKIVSWNHTFKHPYIYTYKYHSYEPWNPTRWVCLMHPYDPQSY